MVPTQSLGRFIIEIRGDLAQTFHHASMLFHCHCSLALSCQYLFISMFFRYITFLDNHFARKCALPYSALPIHWTHVRGSSLSPGFVQYWFTSLMSGCGRQHLFPTPLYEGKSQTRAFTESTCLVEGLPFWNRLSTLFFIIISPYKKKTFLWIINVRQVYNFHLNMWFRRYM